MTEAKKKNTERQLERKTFKLLGSVHHGDTKITQVTVTEPITHQIVHAQRAVAKDPNTHVLTHMLSQISDLPAGAAARLKSRDMGKISKWIKGLNQAALEADGLLQPPANDDASAGDFDGEDPFAIEPEGDGAEHLTDDEIDGFESERTFTLISPFEYEGTRYEKLTCKEPTIDVMMAASRFKIEGEVSVAMVAGITGQPIPVINRLVQRDLVRMETWLAPFVRDLSAETGGT